MDYPVSWSMETTNKAQQAATIVDNQINEAKAKTIKYADRVVIALNLEDARKVLSGFQTLSGTLESEEAKIFSRLALRIEKTLKIRGAI